MKLHDWQTCFAPRILRRGEDYYASGAVDSPRWEGATISATVHGTA